MTALWKSARGVQCKAEPKCLEDAGLEALMYVITDRFLFRKRERREFDHKVALLRVHFLRETNKSLLSLEHFGHL